MAEEWNEAQNKDADTKSYQSQASAATNASKASYVKRMEAAKGHANKDDFDTGSMTSEARQKKAENVMASKIASEVL